ncbi:MAG: polyphosphate kinase 2, partial [Burkholderiaceae bacterium]
MDEKTLDSQAMERLREELLDTLDEELELELEDETLVFPAGGEHPNIVESASALPRRVYFTELIRLQRELVKLQDWVVAHKFRLVVV